MDRRRMIVLLVVALVASCSNGGHLDNDGLPQRDRPPQPPEGVEATGPIETLAMGSAHGSWWRLSVHPSPDGWCTLLETGDGSARSRCGGLPPATDDSIYNEISWGTDANMASVIGFTTEELTAAEVQSRDRRSIPAHIIQVDKEDLDMYVVVALAPRNTSFVSISSLDAAGEVVDVTDLTLPPPVILPPPSP